ncbi:MAG TPA: bifunctional 4-hydroxy-2-oxoglutarate aldolase/2-dehydro-3-deoxy-phosphogluconate aldolase [Candidatus Angelobacter sp.]|nr:bifunctional 4-hydroxy-2-oxoglutarate aldolase/2-dehydro-3-deoxy-phosphogluconate aldolase [Candidatus Angelobacter sp.]
MTKNEVRERILDIGIIPVIRAESPSQAVQAAEAVCNGGIPIVEITMTVPNAVEALRQLSRDMKSRLLVGAGTVLRADMVEQCVDAGAEFIVTPGYNREAVARTKGLDKLVMTGALTPTEVMEAWAAESDFVKIFPCGSVGGPKYIKALKGPFPNVAMIPTGGVNLQNAADFLHAGADALGIGGELVLAAALKRGDLRAITAAAQQFVEIVRQTRIHRAA